VKTLELTIEDRTQFQYILPAQGNIKTLELVESILNKIEIMTKQETIEIEFEEEEIILMRQSVQFLDESQRLSFKSLGLAKKILRS
jgi:hypothetical protein